MKSNSSSFSRRRFLQTAATAAIAAPLLIRCSSEKKPRNGKINHACIGVGGMGWQDIQKIRM